VSDPVTSASGIPRTGGGPAAGHEPVGRAASGPWATAKSDADTTPQPRHTAPLSVVVGAVQSAQGAILPALFVAFSSRSSGIWIGVAAGLALAAIGALFAYISWRRLTYTIQQQDIRVESGVLSRSARSVPYERIQDVSLEQGFIPRLFGLVAVKFETGSGGGEDLSLAFLKEAEGEKLRRLVRERRDTRETTAADGHAGHTPAAARADGGEKLFAMGPRRLFTFGLFEFSLAVFAVLGGLLQYADSFFDVEIWDPDVWQVFFEDQAGIIAALGPSAQVIGAIAGLIGVFLIGSATGLVRVFLREWNFLLERTARGFRRRRGMFTRTDVVMPIHRVQGIHIATRAIRYRFGWHSLRFVSLAQDAGASSHVVAPFAKLDEIEPIVAAAGFHLPGDDADWHHASQRYLVDDVVLDMIWIAIAGIVGWALVDAYAPEWSDAVIGITLMIAGLSAIVDGIAWQFRRHTLDATQIAARSGILSPRSQIATRLKLHSVEIAQGPIARLRGYATLHLGQAGGVFAIPGVPIDRAREVRRRVLETIAATDFSRLETQSGAARA